MQKVAELLQEAEEEEKEDFWIHLLTLTVCAINPDAPAQLEEDAWIETWELSSQLTRSLERKIPSSLPGETLTEIPAPEASALDRELTWTSLQDFTTPASASETACQLQLGIHSRS